jgi:hypothetical protein
MEARAKCTKSKWFQTVFVANKKPFQFFERVNDCGPTWNRTKHLLIMSQLL